MIKIPTCATPGMGQCSMRGSEKALRRWASSSSEGRESMRKKNASQLGFVWRRSAM